MPSSTTLSTSLEHASSTAVLGIGFFLYDCLNGVAVFVYAPFSYATIHPGTLGAMRAFPCATLRSRLVCLFFFGNLDSYIDHSYSTHGNSTTPPRPRT